MPELRDRPSPLRIVVAGDTHIGLRDHNEDTLLIRRELQLYAIADGAGGENAGNVASTMATASVAHHFEETQEAFEAEPMFDLLGLPSAAKRLAIAVQKANRDIVELARTSDRYRGMGTTLVACFLQQDLGVMHVAHVGDSRLYRMRSGYFELLTRDHSLVNDVLALKPDIARERAEELPRRVVTRALGMEETVRVDVTSHHIFPGDRFLLCTDGLSDQLDEEQISEALLQDVPPENQVRLLLDVANAAGAQDNVALVVIDCRLAPGASWDRPPVPLRARHERPAPQVDDDDDDEPELMIVGGDEADGEEPDSVELHVVPSDSVRPEAAEAVRDFVLPLPASERRAGDRDPTVRFTRKCPRCGQHFGGAADMCPNCWDGA